MPAKASDTEILKKERQAALVELIRVGSRMSNILFNLKQKKIEDFTHESDALLFINAAGELQEAWDKALTRTRASQKP